MVNPRPITRPPRTACAWSSSPRARFHLRDHPSRRLRANVRQQIDYVRRQGPIAGAPKRVLVIGASTGYGLAARISAAFAGGAQTLGVFFERPSEPSKPGTPGWHNSAAFHQFAQAEGLYARSINGDAFSDEIKRQVIEAIRADLGQVDQVVYSLAAPRRSHPRDGKVYTSVLKPVGRAVTLRGLDTDREVVRESTLEPATQDEIDATVAVMGGEDWQMWIDTLLEAGVLAEGATTTAFTYLGERITHDIYWNGSIGAAKKDLDRKVLDIRAKLAARGGDARVSVLKAVVTQASSAIPMMPLYLSLLFKVMKAEGTHEAASNRSTACTAMASAAPRRCGTKKAGCAWTTGNWRPPCRRACRNCGTRSRPTTSTN